jgi:L-lactate dehydrogenase complex protein LldE
VRVALFMTCFNDTLYPQTGQAVVRLLERLGCEVDFPVEQTCCGQMHVNTGYASMVEPLFTRYAEVFDGYDAVVVPSGSCAALVRHQHPPSPAREKTYELTELLVDVLGVTDVGASFPHRVTYHPTCHSLRLLQVGDRPLRLLREVRGLDLVDLPQAEQCCGFGGTFALKNAETSTAMMSSKIRAVLDTGAEVLTAADNSCLAHLDGGLRRLSAGIRVMHLAEILASTDGPVGPSGKVGVA